MFNNREIATIIWLSIGLSWVLFKMKDKKSLIALIKAPFHHKILIPYLSGVLYTLLGVTILAYFDLWTKNEVKDTILWCVFAVFGTMLDLQKASENKNYFKEAVKENLKFTLFIEFITGLYTFSLLAELILMPILVLLGLLIAFSERDKKNMGVHRFLKNILALVGLFVLGYTIYEIHIHFKEFASLDTVRNLILSPLLAIWFLPFLYLLSLYSTYEQYNIALGYKFQNKKLFRFAKRQAFLKFNVDVKSFDRWRNTLYRDRLTTRKEVLDSIKELKRLQATEKNPPIVDENIGWSPYAAKDYLVIKGISTRFYTNGYDDTWFASSDYIKLDEELAGNTITYFIEGNETIATTLSLVLNINNTKNSEEAIKKFAEYASFLYTMALKATLPKQIEKALIKCEDSTTTNGKIDIIVKKENWHSQGKYSLLFSLNINKDMNEFDLHLLEVFNKGKVTFFQREINNILNRVSERNLCGRLAIYLDNSLTSNNLEGYYADPEYNRNQNGTVKTILDENNVVVSISCDVIIHSRGEIVGKDNLVAIEMKKSNRPDSEKNDDRKRLRALTKDSYDDIWSADGLTLPEHVCGYHIGIYMELDIEKRICIFELYQKGKKISSWKENY